MQHNIKTNCVFFISQLFFTRVSNVLSKWLRTLHHLDVMCHDHPRGWWSYDCPSAPCAMIRYLVIIQVVEGPLLAKLCITDDDV